MNGESAADLSGRHSMLSSPASMRHYPAHCSDCHRLWLVATQDAPSASPTCPRCKDRGRLVPGAYYSDPASVVFVKLEAAISAARLSLKELAHLALDLEHLLPTPSEAEIEAAFTATIARFGLTEELQGTPGKRVALRMVVTIASTLSEPGVRESGVMRLPQTIRGLFDVAPPKPSDGASQKRES
jgi:hypothetical protein